MNNTFRANYWDDYQGFDRNGDAVGDTPYELYAYSDQLWMEEPNARFFKNAPLMEAIDFLERLAPFVSPARVVLDPQPSMGAVPVRPTHPPAAAAAEPSR